MAKIITLSVRASGLTSLPLPDLPPVDSEKGPSGHQSPLASSRVPEPTLGHGRARIASRRWISHHRIWLCEEGLWGTSSQRSPLSMPQSHLRAPSRTGSTTARSPSRERARRWTDPRAAPWPVALSCVGEFQLRNEKKAARLRGSAPMSGFCSIRESRSVVQSRWSTSFWASLGPGGCSKWRPRP
jgi:hypothetical protein